MAANGRLENKSSEYWISHVKENPLKSHGHPRISLYPGDWTNFDLCLLRNIIQVPLFRNNSVYKNQIRANKRTIRLIRNFRDMPPSYQSINEENMRPNEVFSICELTGLDQTKSYGEQLFRNNLIFRPPPYPTPPHYSQVDLENIN